MIPAIFKDVVCVKICSPYHFLFLIGHIGHTPCCSMMVDGLFLLHIVIFLDCQDSNLQEWNQNPIDKPDVHHSDVGGGRKLLHDTDEEGCNHQHDRQIDRECCLKEELFEECCSVDNPHEKKGRKVGGEDLIGQSSFEYDLHLHTLVSINCKTKPLE